jgi:glycine/serine hydroxymethyltransferase
MPVDIADISRIVEAQEQWRGTQTINLIASENALSPAVRAIGVIRSIAITRAHNILTRSRP